MWTARGPFRRDRWSSEDEEAAGPSQALSPLLSGLEHLRILVSVGGPGTNPLQIQRDNSSTSI
ncbi:PTPN20 isoform 1 [Pongo abelii]|uniref:PTPN20 isoform 1 n=1 Tax=Pongo abelii TaxID=9601 RepID=A0A2J8RSU4_PONAB|nr:PTPN20 isoform 1 [Pongo abelii]